MLTNSMIMYWNITRRLHCGEGLCKGCFAKYNKKWVLYCFYAIVLRHTIVDHIIMFSLFFCKLIIELFEYTIYFAYFLKKLFTLQGFKKLTYLSFFLFLQQSIIIIQVLEVCKIFSVHLIVSFPFSATFLFFFSFLFIVFLCFILWPSNCLQRERDGKKKTTKWLQII